MDEKAFGEIYQTHLDAIFRHCYFRVSDRDQAQDLAQATFIKTWEYLRKGKRIDNMKAFLYKVANNLVVDYYRQKKAISLDALKEKGFEPVGDRGDKVINKLDEEILKNMLYLIKKEYREIMVMRYVDGLKPRDISEITGESQNVISVRIYRAVKAFRKVVKARGYATKLG